MKTKFLNIIITIILTFILPQFALASGGMGGVALFLGLGLIISCIIYGILLLISIKLFISSKKGLQTKKIINFFFIFFSILSLPVYIFLLWVHHMLPDNDKDYLMYEACICSFMLLPYIFYYSSLYKSYRNKTFTKVTFYLVTLLILFSISIVVIGINFRNDRISQEKQRKAELAKLEKTNFKTLKGLIDDKYPISMKLGFYEKQVNGNYFYNKYAKELDLDGFITNNGEIHLNEKQPNYSKISEANIIINFDSINQTYKGIWKSNKDTFNIYLEPSKKNYEGLLNTYKNLIKENDPFIRYGMQSEDLRIIKLSDINNLESVNPLNSDHPLIEKIYKITYEKGKQLGFKTFMAYNKKHWFTYLNYDDINWELSDINENLESITFSNPNKPANIWTDDIIIIRERTSKKIMKLEYSTRYEGGRTKTSMIRNRKYDWAQWKLSDYVFSN